MARIGKIARLPRHIRAQLNARLQDGHEGKKTVQWLNSLPEVKAVLAANFEGRPINGQNLCEWRRGGYAEWRIWKDLLAHLRQPGPGPAQPPDAARFRPSQGQSSPGQG